MPTPYSHARAYIYTVLTSCTRITFTDMRPAYEHPLPHPAAIKNPQEKRHTINITATWTECTESAPHGDTVTQIAKRRRSKTNRIEMMSIQHSKNLREGEGSNSFLHGKPRGTSRDQKAGKRADYCHTIQYQHEETKPQRTAPHAAHAPHYISTITLE